MPALMRLASDILDVRLGLAQAIADLFILGAFYGDKSLPVPAMIKRIVRLLAHDESGDVRDALREVGADRWASSDDSSASASDALDEATSETENPEGLANRVSEAMASEADEASSLLAEPHHRAEIPSPNLDDDSDVLSMVSSDDPFEASFARAQADVGRKSSKPGSADSVLAAAKRASTLPEGMEGSPPLTPAGDATPTYGLGINVRDNNGQDTTPRQTTMAAPP